MTLDDVRPGVTTQRYHNNGRLIMLEVNCIKFSLGIQNSLGMIMCKFHARQSKPEGMAASVREFLEHPSYIMILNSKMIFWTYILEYLKSLSLPNSKMSLPQSVIARKKTNTNLGSNACEPQLQYIPYDALAFFSLGAVRALKLN